MEVKDVLALGGKGSLSAEALTWLQVFLPGNIPLASSHFSLHNSSRVELTSQTKPHLKAPGAS